MLQTEQNVAYRSVFLYHLILTKIDQEARRFRQMIVNFIHCGVCTCTLLVVPVLLCHLCASHRYYSFSSIQVISFKNLNKISWPSFSCKSSLGFNNKQSKSWFLHFSASACSTDIYVIILIKFLVNSWLHSFDICMSDSQILHWLRSKCLVCCQHIDLRIWMLPLQF